MEPGLAICETKMATQTENVRTVFENADWYLKGWRYSIKIRTETVREFVKGHEFKSILDVGCGDGSISIPLLCPQTQMTLLDISASMLASARRQIPSEFLPNVDVVNQEFLEANLAGGYDLLLCIGLLAHVSSPSAVVEKIGSLVAPGGYVIAESTAKNHFVTRVIMAYGEVRGMFTPASYVPAALATKDVVAMFAQQGLELVSVFRYSLPLPGMTRLFSERALYRLSRMLYGSFPRNRNARLGNELVYLFRKAA